MSVSLKRKIRCLFLSSLFYQSTLHPENFKTQQFIDFIKQLVEYGLYYYIFLETQNKGISVTLYIRCLFLPWILLVGDKLRVESRSHSRMVFLNLSIADILDQIIFCCGGSLMKRRMVINILGLCPQDASSTSLFVTIRNASRHHQTLFSPDIVHSLTNPPDFPTLPLGITTLGHGPYS